MEDLGRMFMEECLLSCANEKISKAVKTFTEKDEETVKKIMAEVSEILGYKVWTNNPLGFGFKEGKPTGWIYNLEICSRKVIAAKALEKALAETLLKHGVEVLVDNNQIIRYFTYTQPPCGNYFLHKIYGENTSPKKVILFADDDFSSIKKENLKPLTV